MTWVVHPKLCLALAGTVALAAWSLWAPGGSALPPETVAAVERGVGHSATLPLVQSLTVRASDQRDTTAQTLEPAVRDPFSGPALTPQGLPRTSSTAAPPQTMVVTPSLTSMPVSVAPPVPRYLGLLRTPGGSSIVLLSDGLVAVEAQINTRLPSGWAILAVEPDKVRLTFPGTESVASVDVPPSAELTR